MDVNEHERLSNITFRQNNVKEQCFNCRFTVHSHSRVFNDEHNSYPKGSVKQPLAFTWVVLFTFVDRCYIWASLSTWGWVYCLWCWNATMFLLYRGGQFYWWRYSEKTTDLSQVIDKSFWCIEFCRMHCYQKEKKLEVILQILLSLCHQNTMLQMKSKHMAPIE